MRRVTMDDIADRLGLSKYAISRSLSGKPGVSEATRERVLAAAREMGYTSPRRNSRHRRRTSRNVVLVIPKYDLHDPEFWMDVIAGAEEEARLLGYDLITRPLTEDTMREGTSLRGVAGLVVAGSRARPAMQQYLAEGIPVVLITYPEPLEQLHSVTTADWEGGFAVAQYLLDLGHRRLGFVTDSPDRPSHFWRSQGFHAAASKTPDTVLHEIHLEGNVSFEDRFAELSATGQQPTALFAATDGIALNVMWALNRRGLTVPGDVSVVGCNDTHPAQRSVPPLTTLHLQKRQIGAEAVRCLTKQIRGTADGESLRRIALLPRLVVRDSTAPPAH